jgi:hypothetical protein
MTSTQYNQNFTMKQGEDKTITVALTSDGTTPYGSTAGLTFTWKVFTDENATSALITKTTSSGITNGTSQITIAVAKADTSGQSPANYFHECRVVDGSSKEEVVFSGGLNLLASPTK